MLKWIFILLLAIGGFFAYQNRTQLVKQWNASAAQLQHMAGLKNDAAGSKGGGLFSSAFTPTTWSPQDVAGIRVNVPFPLESATPAGSAATLPSFIQAENYYASRGAYSFGVLHLQNTRLVGGLMLGWADPLFGGIAHQLNMTVLSQNTATVLLNGFRARRSDYASRTTPRIRVRALLLEKGNQAWFLEYHAPESDANAERAYLQMADSTRAL